VLELFNVVAGVKKITLADAIKAYIREHLGSRPLTGSDVEAILTRAKERAVLAKRDEDVQLEICRRRWIHSLIRWIRNCWPCRNWPRCWHVPTGATCRNATARPTARRSWRNSRS